MQQEVTSSPGSESLLEKDEISNFGIKDAIGTPLGTVKLEHLASVDEVQAEHSNADVEEGDVLLESLRDTAHVFSRRARSIDASKKKSKRQFESMHDTRNLRSTVKTITAEDRQKINRKPQKLVMDEESEIAFIRNMFFYQGTVVSSIWPQLLAVWISVLIASYIYVKFGEPSYLVPPDAENMFTTVGAALAFLVAFRVNQSQGSYVEGRKIMGMISNNLREVVQASSTYRLKDACDQETMLSYQAEVCRLANLQYAVIRQQLREHHAGFDPDSHLNIPDISLMGFKMMPPPEQEIEQNFKQKWHLDPVTPFISTLMTEDEYQTLNRTAPPIRPVMVQKSLLLVTHELAQHLEHSGFFVMQVTRKLEDCLDFYKSALRIIDTPIPVPYRHFLYVITFCFVYISPWIYVVNDKGLIYSSSWLVSTAICVTYYGMMELAAALQDPFGWDAVDLDLDAMGMKIMKETFKISETQIDERWAGKDLAPVSNSLR